MLIKPCTYFYERYPATCKALRLVLVICLLAVRYGSYHYFHLYLTLLLNRKEGPYS